jgi:hypothetical protein
VTDPFQFGEYFFRDEWLEGKGLPPFARDVYDLIEAGHPKTAVVLPRGFLKSTLTSQIYGLYLALTVPGIYVIIATASPQLRDDISLQHDHQLRNNERLRKFFGDQVSRNDIRWNNRKKVLRNGSEIGYRTRGESVRGTKTQRGKRPHVIILDDIEKGDEVQGEQVVEHTKKLVRWISADVEPALAPGGRIILANNIIARAALTNRVVEGELGGWATMVRSACDFEAGSVLWLEHPDFGRIEFWRAKLDELNRANLGHIFWAEYQNRPVDEVDKAFTADMLRRYRRADILGPDGPVFPLRLFCCIDLAYTKKKKSDKTAWIVGATDWKNDVYLLEARKKKLGLAERENLAIDIRDRWRHLGLNTVYIEGHTDFFESLAREQERRKKDDPRYTFFHVEPLKHGGVSKTDRIKTLPPNMRTLFYPVLDLVETAPGEWGYDPEVKELVDELLDWSPASQVDDLTDALAYLRRVAEPAQRPELARAAGVPLNDASREFAAAIRRRQNNASSIAGVKKPDRFG